MSEAEAQSAQPQALSLDEVRHVAQLSRLRLSEAQLEAYRTQLTSVLHYVAKLRELDLEGMGGLEPMAHPIEIANRLDDDEVAAPMPFEKFAQNAPAVEGRYLAVPKVLGES